MAASDVIRVIQNSEKGKRWVKNVEIAGGILLSLALIFKSFHIIYGNIFITVSLSAFIDIFIIIGFYKFDSDSKILSALFYKTYGFGLAFATLKLLALLNHWDLFVNIYWLIAISFPIILSLIFGISESLGENKNRIDGRYFLRIILVCCLLTYYFLLRNGYLG